MTDIWDRDAIFELKWRHEVETENRLKGDIVCSKPSTSSERSLASLSL
jgi:hypothetical protein